MSDDGDAHGYCTELRSGLNPKTTKTAEEGKNHADRNDYWQRLGDAKE